MLLIAFLLLNWTATPDRRSLPALQGCARFAETRFWSNRSHY